MTTTIRVKKLEIHATKTKDYVLYDKTEPLSDSGKVYNFVKQFYADDLELYESFYLLLMNNRHKPLGWAKIGYGGVTGVLVDVKIIGKYICDTLARCVCLVHNHPSGGLEPSAQDKELTRQIVGVCKLLDVQCVEHIILSTNDYYSFHDNGMI